MAESATKVAPHSAQGLVLMGRVQAAKGCPQDARQWFEKAVRSDSKCAQAPIALADIHRTVRCSLSYWLSYCAEVQRCSPAFHSLQSARLCSILFRAPVSYQIRYIREFVHVHDLGYTESWGFV